VRYAQRIDSATLRERFMMFAAGLLIVVGTLHAALVEPQVAEQRRLTAQQAQRQLEGAKLQAEVQKLASGRRQDPNAEARARVDALRQELAQLNGAIAEEQKKFTAPEQMRTVLEEMLSRNRKLRLMDMKTLPLATLSDARTQDSSGKAASGADRLIYRHGVQITLSGTYLDMLGYLTELEKLTTQMYWGGMELNVAEYPSATLKLTVYTLSLDRAWMVV
jgi:MSHA biogenesis protein MshJ